MLESGEERNNKRVRCDMMRKIVGVFNLFVNEGRLIQSIVTEMRAV